MDVSETLRIVLLGKTGVGKSSLANTIFREELFAVDHTFNSETKECQAQTKSVKGRKMTVIDTPGFFDTDRPEEQTKAEILRCITECSPGPHAFLIVLKVEKLTEHEKDVITKIYECFSEEVLKYATVLFTHGDQLPEGQTIKDFVSQNEFMSDLVKKCSGRCHVFDNKYWKKKPKRKYRSNQFQVEELLKTIDQTVLENNRGYYTNEILQAVEEKIQQEEENIRRSSRNMSEEKIRQWAKAKVFKKLMAKIAGVSTGVLLGAFLGVAVMVGSVVTVLKSGSESVQLQQAMAKTAAAAGAGVGLGTLGVIGGAVAGGTAAGGVAGITGSVILAATAVAAAAGAVKGGLIGYNAADGADTPREAAKKAAEAVKREAQSCLDKTKEGWNNLSQPKSKQSQNF